MQDLAFDVFGDTEVSERKNKEVRSPRIWAEISVNKCECLIDTGSTVTCIRESIFEQLKNETDIKILPVTNIVLTGAFLKKSCRVKNQIFTNLIIGNLKIKTVLLVVPKLAYDIILGIDWILCNNIVIDGKNRKLIIDKVTICEPYVSFSAQLPEFYREAHLLERLDLCGGNACVPTRKENLQICKLSFEAGDSDRFFSSGYGFESRVDAHLDQIKGISDFKKQNLKQLILQFRGVFSDEPGCFLGYKYKFKLNCENPRIFQTYSIPITYRDAVERQLEMLLKNEIIEASDSPYCNPIRVVVKKNGDVRLCLDARNLNKYIEPDNEKPPRIEDVIQDHEGMRVFTSTDLAQGYYQIVLDEDCRKYTAFNVGGRCFQWRRVPFGIRTAGSAFIRALNSVFNYTEKKFLIIYVDDVLIRSRNFAEHIEHLKLFLSRMQSVGLTLKLGKTLFCRNEVPFLGFILNSDGIRPDPQRVDTIMQMPEPKNRSELQKCIGMCTFYRRFYDKYALLINPFRDLLSSKNKFIWSDDHRCAFKTLKEKLANYILLSHYRHDLPFILQTDASKSGISAVLYQINEDGEQIIIALISRCLSGYEIRYTATELELLAVVYAVIKLKDFLLGQTFEIITDHQALTFLLKTPYHTSRLARWSMILTPFSYKISHCKGKENVIADYFSRIVRNMNETKPISETEGVSNTRNDQCLVLPINLIASVRIKHTWFPTAKDIIKMQSEDEKLKKLKKEIADNKYNNYKIFNDIIFYKPLKELGWRIVVPVAIKNKLIIETHERIGHLGVFKTIAELKKNFWWSSMRKHIKSLVVSCDICQRTKPLNKTMTGKYMQVKSEKPNDLVAVDYYGPLPRSTGGVEYIFVLVDVFSRLVTLYPLKRATASASINRLRDYFERVGKPKRILSDHGTQFLSKIWADFLKDHNIESIYCSVRHPQSNVSERTMRELSRFFRCYCSDQHSAWARHIKQINDWLNFATHTVTGYTPYELHYGKKPHDQIRAQIVFPPEEIEPDFIKIELANLRTKKLHERQRNAQKNYNNDPIRVDDLVLLRVPKQSNAFNKTISKFFHIYYGPYRIARSFNENAYELVDVDNPRNIVGRYNRADLRLYKTIPTGEAE